MPYDYYQAKYSVVTALRAMRMRLQPKRAYGYYVLITPPPPDRLCKSNNYAIEAWCKTKGIAESLVADNERYQKTGCFGCPCGSGKQKRACHPD